MDTKDTLPAPGAGTDTENVAPANVTIGEITVHEPDEVVPLSPVTGQK